MSVIILKNQTVSPIILNNLSLPDRTIPGSGQVTATDWNSERSIAEDAELSSLIASGDVIINLDGLDLDPGVGLGGTAPHAFSHQNDGADEIAVSEFAVGAIPKGGSDGLHWSWTDKSQIVSVAKSGGRFTSVKDAMDAIIDADVDTKPYVIEVGPGFFTETPFAMKSGVSIRGSGFYDTVLLTSNNSSHFITGEPESMISCLSIVGPTGSGYACLYYASASLLPFWVRLVTFRKGYYGVWSNVSSSRGIVHCELVGNHYEGAMQDFFRATLYGNIMALNCGFMSGPPSAVSHGYHVEGADAEMTLYNCTHRNDGSIGILVDNGASIHGSVVLAKGDKAIVVGPSGASSVDLRGAIVFGGGWSTEIDIQTASASVAFEGTFDRSKVSFIGAVPPSLSGSAADGFQVSSEFWMGLGSSSFPAGSYFSATFNSGRISGGEVSKAAGLNVAISAGVGYVSVGGISSRITWDAVLSLSVTANALSHIYVTSAGVVMTTTGIPNYSESVTLAALHAGSSSVVSIAIDRVTLGQRTQGFHNYMHAILGVRVASGCAATEHSAPSLQIAVDAGSYYAPDELVTVGSNSPATWTTWYRDGAGGWAHVFSQAAVNATQYDDGTGTLAAMTSAKYRKDLLYLNYTDDTAVEDYHLVLGQEEFDSQELAEVGDNPAVPSFVFHVALKVAGVVVLKDATGLTSLIDERPGEVGAGSGTGSSGVSDHGALSGLVDDDHQQYLLLNGFRAMTGSLDMGANAISNVGLVDGVDISVHGSRHISGAVDEVDGDKLDIDWVPTNYARDATPTEVDSTSQLTAHLKGIDTMVGSVTIPVFGTEYLYASSDGTSSTSSTTYIQKLTLAVPTIPAGTYRIGWSVEMDESNGNDAEYQVHLDNSTVLGNGVNDRGAFFDLGGFIHTALSNASHTIDLDYRSGGVGSVSIRRVRLEFWRVA